jgi:hypothetical protein
VSTNYTQPLAIDPSNNVWTSDTGNSALVRIAATSGPGVASTGTNYGISTGGTTMTGNSTMTIDGNGVVYQTIVGATNPTYNATFGTANNTGVAVLVPAITGGVLTAASGSSVQKLSGNTNKGSAISNFNTSGTNNYGGLAYVGTGTTTCSASDTAGLNTFFSQSQTITGSGSNTTTTVGEPTPIGIVTNSLGFKTPCTTGTAATPTTATQTYNGSSYTIPAMDAPLGMAVDASDNIWTINDPGVVASGYPEFWVTQLVPTYSVSPTTGALSASYAANLYTAPFLSGTSGGATLTFNPNVPNGLAVDGNGNVFFASAGSGTIAAVNQAGTFLNPTTPTIQAVTSGSNSSTWTCAGFCGGLEYADNGNKRTKGNGFAGMAIDLAGNVWGGQASTGAHNITVIVGVAAPPVLPISLAVRNHALGTKP